MGYEYAPDYSNTPVSPFRPRFGYAPLDPAAPPIVSLVTPFFNAGAIFSETAESVFRQSLQQWEWLVVDDGSDDPESAGLLQRCTRDDPRVRVIGSPHRGGPAAARNRGVNAARGAYVAFLDADDLLEPTALEKWLWFLECHPQFGMVKGYQAGFGAEQYIWREGFHSGSAILESNIIQTASMMRREVYLAAGGEDESIRGGLEDWDFWLRCASAGYWGGTVPEVLDWYRRRPAHSTRWEDWDFGSRQNAFRAGLRKRHARLFEGSFPQPALSLQQPFAELPGRPGFDNLLSRSPATSRVLVLVPHLALGGSDQVTLDLISQLIDDHKWEVTVAATLPGPHNWRHKYEALTPDVFTMDTFLSLRDYPRFLSYLIRSRNISSVLITHSQLGYQLLPYLRSEHPGLTCYDYVHIEEPDWKQGGYPAFSVAYRSFLDGTASSSGHLKEWMTGRGASAGSISVVTTNIDTEAWRRDRFDASALRQKWAIPEGLPALLYVGRLCEQKQPSVLAATMLALHDRGLRFHCLVAGDGEQGPWLTAFIRQHKLSEVVMIGSRSLDEIRELLAISDIFFLPSKHEGISQTLFEAMAMETVTVGADVGGQRELLDPSCGILLQRGPDEAARYADVIASLLTDDARRSAMARAGRARVVDHFELHEMGRQMNRLLRGECDTSVFDLDRALRAFPAAHTREVLEQRRVELLADRLWTDQNVSGTATPLTARILGSAAARFLSGLARRALRAVALLRPLFTGGQFRRNRNLMWRVLIRSASRRELLSEFDRDFYCCCYPDVPRGGPLPLLHYVFWGYLEGRRPSAGFDSAILFSAYPHLSSGETNPLLWKILLRAQDRAAKRNQR
jgi:glycosyltransferase involved in cell wall biosynthesis